MVKPDSFNQMFQDPLASQLLSVPWGLPPHSVLQAATFLTNQLPFCFCRSLSLSVVHNQRMRAQKRPRKGVLVPRKQLGSPSVEQGRLAGVRPGLRLSGGMRERGFLLS